jgi:sulfite exporter TauE/SafE
MTELPLIFIGGFLGSSHCISMCGPLALALGANQNRVRTNVCRQLVFTLGRILTYSFLGVVASYTGWWLLQQPQTFINVQSVLSIVAGAVLVVLGLSYAGTIRFPTGWLSPATLCTSAKWLKTLLMGPGYTTALLAGVFTGFIPCGLVYALLGIAATTGDLAQGWLTMVAFGLGTAPLMLLAGGGGTLLSHVARGRVLKIAATCVVVMGVISIARGAGLIHGSSHVSISRPSPGTPRIDPFCR